MNLADAPDVLTVDQVAELLRISRGSAYEAVKSGEVPSVRIGRSIRCPKHALEQLLHTAGRKGVR